MKTLPRAISLCKGELIVLCDQDDFWLPNKLSSMIQALNNSPQSTLVVANASIANRELQTTGEKLYSERFLCQLKADKIASSLLGGIGINGCTLAFRAQFLPYLLPIPADTWGHDHWIALFLLMTAPVAVVPEPVMLYRRHNQSSGNNLRFERNRFIRIYKRLGRMLAHIAVADYRYYATRWEFLLQRLEMLRTNGDPLVNGERLEAGITVVQQWYDFSAMRLQLRERTRLTRFSPAFHNLLRGRYGAYANGVAAFFKDIIA